MAQKDISFSSYHLKDKYVELKHRKRMQLKSRIFQKSQEFSNDLEKDF
jgi:hypothetical protein